MENKINKHTSNESVEDLISNVNSGSVHLDSGRQARTVILEDEKSDKNIYIDNENNHSTMLSQYDVDDAEAIMLMINENLA